MRTVYDSLSPTYEVVLVGDLNARICDQFPYRGTLYERNPDRIVNHHGIQLNQVISCCDNMKVVNGAIVNDKVYDSNFTYYSGNRKSQNDWCLTNDIGLISDFTILPKKIYSDHCPCLVQVRYRKWPPLGMIYDCSVGFKSHIHYDVNRKLPKTIKIDDLNLVTLGEILEEKAEQMLQKYANIEPTQHNIDNLCNEITDTIRGAGMKCQIKDRTPPPSI